MQYAVIKTGGKQYRVSEGDKLLIEKLNRKIGDEFDFEEVLITGNKDAESAKIGQPIVKDAKVHARVIEHGKSVKKVVFKFHHKTRYKKLKGHRQPFSKIEILKISA